MLKKIGNTKVFVGCNKAVLLIKKTNETPFSPTNILVATIVHKMQKPASKCL